MTSNDSVTLSRFLAEVYKENGGILVLAGKLRDRAYSDQAVILGLTKLLNEQKLAHMAFPQTLVDFHKKNRRYRRVKVVVSMDYLHYAPANPISSVGLAAFREKCTAHEYELDRWMARQEKFLFTIADGAENKELHDIMTMTGSPVEQIKIINLFYTGTNRANDEIANVYGIKKPA